VRCCSVTGIYSHSDLGRGVWRQKRALSRISKNTHRLSICITDQDPYPTPNTNTQLITRHRSASTSPNRHGAGVPQPGGHQSSRADATTPLPAHKQHPIPQARRHSKQPSSTMVCTLRSLYVSSNSLCENADNLPTGPPYKPLHRSWQRTSRVSLPICQSIPICSVERSCTHLRIILVAHKKA
jgi:hypothetical protein